MRELFGYFCEGCGTVRMFSHKLRNNQKDRWNYCGACDTSSFFLPLIIDFEARKFVTTED